MSVSLRQLLIFKKTLLQFSKDLIEECGEGDDVLAMVFNEEYERLERQVRRLTFEVSKLPPEPKKLRQKKIIKKTAKTRRNK